MIVEAHRMRQAKSRCAGIRTLIKPLRVSVRAKCRRLLAGAGLTILNLVSIGRWSQSAGSFSARAQAGVPLLLGNNIRIHTQAKMAQTRSAPRSAQSGAAKPPAPRQPLACKQQCWASYKDYLGWGCGVGGGASAVVSCALACSPLLLGGPQAYGACFARCGVLAGGAIAACAGGTTPRYWQCGNACNTRVSM